ncbi:mannitol dehydrogenase family protein [Corynebacterium sp. 3HC-13]|uniref:mannitol dehydrogenase family protein n=1 Tax=Corynebacterium poyangense TaxID=2684405 RepID=UPI001CCE8F56|nr:mannitol dehydrogenase family protein [Corynebacterium poyangense]MBZ8177149.1 mannitol dehydrogenase family protein [Corynebacterium poyangense]
MTSLVRSSDTPTPPIRLVHLGLGAFHRAHQVWYTQHAENNPQQPEWGYASFTGRSPRMSEVLSPQGGLYTLVTRSEDGDTCELISSLVEANPAHNISRLVELVASADVAVLTLTITEAGYHLDEQGHLDLHHPQVNEDLADLRRRDFSALRTAAARIVVALHARRQQSDVGLAVMSCDNISANGAATKATVLGMAQEWDPELAQWISGNVTFPSTSIDRITPATEDSLATVVEQNCGYRDAAPVVTEPFANWIIRGEFPVGRPNWERAGVEFVADIEAFERRKLWLLNGSHSLMAYAGRSVGAETVAQAIAIPEVRSRVEEFWQAASTFLDQPELAVPDYREALIQRFNNPRIEHYLSQIGIDGATKLRMRSVPVIRRCLEAGRNDLIPGAAAPIQAWVTWLLQGGDFQDTRASDIDVALHQAHPVQALVAVLDQDLSHNPDVLAAVSSLSEEK